MVHITLRNTVGKPDDASRSRHMASQGFGLGLSFVKTVVRKHQGHIQLDLPTQAGATAEVRVQMPMAKPYC
jgi:signal transduction histidine kinase